MDRAPPDETGDGRAAPDRPDGAAQTDADLAPRLCEMGHELLPTRGPVVAAPPRDVPALGAADARAALDRRLAEAMEAIAAWHDGPGRTPCRIGIRATVGLGKSTLARLHLLALRERLHAAGHPSRILIFTPTLALADEMAAAFPASGASVAVHRGYHASAPDGAPMCLDPEAVQLALNAGTGVHRTVCVPCVHAEACLKQQNRNEVAKADIVVAASDALFSGLPVDPASVGAILIDEGFWQRAWQQDSIDIADLLPPAGRTAGALPGNPFSPGTRLFRVLSQADSLDRGRLLAAGIDAAACRDAARFEATRRTVPSLHPSMTRGERVIAAEEAALTRQSVWIERLWWALADIPEGGATGRVWLRNGRIGLATPKQVHATLADRPILHLDATLRPEITDRILPGLQVTEIAAATPWMTLTQISGPFGKSSLVPDARANAAEASRRAANLAALVTHVRWHAMVHAPRRVLVVTYLGIEAHFAGIPGVVTAHFNAIAGLDGFGDVAALVVIGRPLPRDTDLAQPAAALFGLEIRGGYERRWRDVRLSSGTSVRLEVLTHPDRPAETLRAAICDDEVVQAIGRGRGVNRTAETPLEVQVLADVALPLVHDQVTCWARTKPDLIQKMLIAGIAVDSPKDASSLYPELFRNPRQAEKAFERQAFGRHFPMGVTYRGLSVKSATYRRQGRGRSKQRAWWHDGAADVARATLESRLGTLALWEPAPPD